MLKHTLYFLLSPLMIIVLFSGCSEWELKPRSSIYYDASYDFEVEKIWFSHGAILMLAKGSDTVYSVWDGPRDRDGHRAIGSFVSEGAHITKRSNDASITVTLSSGETRVVKYDLHCSGSKNKKRCLLFPFL